MKLALALGGGAGLGWAHIGVLRALLERGVVIDAVSGTSIGALAAVCAASDRIDALEELARSTNRRQVMRFIDIDPRKGSVLGGRTVRNRLRQHFGQEQLQDLRLPVAVVAADLVSGGEISITNGSVVDAVRASIAIPGVFPPLRRDNMVLIDGGVLSPVPVRAVRALSAAPVLAVNLQGDYAARAAATLPAGQRLLTPFRVGRAGLSLLLTQLARQGLVIDPPDVEIAPLVGHIDVRNFTRADELIRLGRAAVAADWARIAALG